MRSLFVGHGSPAVAFTENKYQKKWQWLGQNIDRPRAMVFLSAHWLTRGLKVTGSGSLETIYDFNGFPEEFYRYEYQVSGSDEIVSQLSKMQPEPKVDESRGLDHGVWTILKHMYPQADIPVVQLSIDIGLSLAEHIELARLIDQTFSDDVLFVGSGNVVHNLQRLKADPESEPFCWATEFDKQVQEAVAAGDLKRLAELPEDNNVGGPSSVPSLDHYLPVIYVAAMTGAKKPQVILDGIAHGSISMFSFANFE